MWKDGALCHAHGVIRNLCYINWLSKIEFDTFKLCLWGDVKKQRSANNPLTIQAIKANIEGVIHEIEPNAITKPLENRASARPAVAAI